MPAWGGSWGTSFGGWVEAAAPAVKLWRIQSNSSCAGGMWSEQLEIGNYTHFGFAIDPDTGIEYVIVHDTAPDPAIWKCLRKLPNETSFTTRGTIVEVETGYMAGLEVDRSSQHRLVATIKTDDAMKRFYSQDGGLNWTD